MFTSTQFLLTLNWLETL